jgi:hypothetical protein
MPNTPLFLSSQSLEHMATQVVASSFLFSFVRHEFRLHHQLLNLLSGCGTKQSNLASCKARYQIDPAMGNCTTRWSNFSKRWSYITHLAGPLSLLLLKRSPVQQQLRSAKALTLSLVRLCDRLKFRWGGFPWWCFKKKHGNGNRLYCRYPWGLYGKIAAKDAFSLLQWGRLKQEDWDICGCLLQLPVRTTTSQARRRSL